MPRFELWQNGEMVAIVEGRDRVRAKEEIDHYALIYAEDGPCEVRETPMQHVKELPK